MAAEELEDLFLGVRKVGRVFVFVGGNRNSANARRTGNTVAGQSSQDFSAGGTEEVDGGVFPVRCVHGKEGWRLWSTSERYDRTPRVAVERSTGSKLQEYLQNIHIS